MKPGGVGQDAAAGTEQFVAVVIGVSDDPFDLLPEPLGVKSSVNGSFIVVT